MTNLTPGIRTDQDAIAVTDLTRFWGGSLFESRWGSGDYHH